MIKIFGGVARGFTLRAPLSIATRPTSVLLRRKLFDSIQDLSGYFFLDVCAGTGSVGLEAASRNAEEVVFLENSKQSFQILKNNISEMQKKFDLDAKLQAFQIDFHKWFKENYEKTPELKTKEKPSIIFFDPPYEKINYYEDIINFLKENLYHGKLVLEACEQKTMKIDEFQKRFGHFSKVFKQGSSYFVIYDF